MTYYIDKKPVLGRDGILIEEKGSTDERIGEKIRCENCKPPKQVEAGIGL
jgi:hypothetical protein